MEESVDLVLPSRLANVARDSSIELVRQLDQILKDLGELRLATDRPFRCRETPKAVFDAKLKNVKTSYEMNFIYWRDVASSVKAYALSTTWRIIDLAEGLITLIGKNGVLGPGIIARAMIELTVAYILNGGNIREAVARSATSWRDTIIISEDLENLLCKALYGTRLVPKDDLYYQQNIVTQVDKLSKCAGFEDVVVRYTRLCEIAHPNKLGNAIFWDDSVVIDPDGSLIRVGKRNADSGTVTELQEDILWALGWASANCIQGFHILNNQVKTICRAFPSRADAN